MMRVETTLQAGARGTKKYQEEFGDRLVCVRTRRDGVRGRRYTTVELIVDERPGPVETELLAGVRVHLDEPVLRRRVKAAGGRWLSRQRLWAMPMGAVAALNLEDRVVTVFPDGKLPYM